MNDSEKTTWSEWRAAANISENERNISLAAGALLVLLGFSRRSKSGVFIALSGSLLLHRGMTRQSAIYRVLGFSSARATDDIFDAPLLGDTEAAKPSAD